MALPRKIDLVVVLFSDILAEVLVIDLVCDGIKGTTESCKARGYSCRNDDEPVLMPFSVQSYNMILRTEDYFSFSHGLD